MKARRFLGYTLIALPVFAVCIFIVCALDTKVGFVWAITSVGISVVMFVSLVIGVNLSYD